MKTKLKHYAKEIITFFVLLFIATNLLSLYKSTHLEKTPYELQNLQLIDGSTFHFNTTKPLLLHFWATWCPVCQLEAQNIEKLSQNYQVVTIVVKSGNNEKIKEYMKEKNLHFKVYNDSNAKIAQKFKIAAYPTTFVYHPNKNIAFCDVGYTSTFSLMLRLWWASF